MPRRVLLLLVLLGSFQVADVHASTGQTEGSQIAAAHPDWILPGWTHGGPTTWTIVGAPYAASVALVGMDGSFAPQNHGPALDFWIYDVDSGRLLVPGDFNPVLRLDDDYAPIVTSEWHAADLLVSTTFFAGWPTGNVDQWFDGHGDGSDKAVTFIRTTVSTSSDHPRHLVEYVALRPYGVEADVHPLEAVQCDPPTESLIADSLLVLTSLQHVDACGAASVTAGDVSGVAARGGVPGVATITDANKRAEAIMATNTTVQATSPAVLEYRAPIGNVTPGTADVSAADFDHERARVLEAWARATSRTTLDVTDARINGAFKASQAYLLLNRGGPWSRSGPLAHDAAWIRDAAYIGQALERAGFGPEDQATLDAFLRTQRNDGSLPAIVDSSGARSVQELDADGEAISAVVEHYRFSHDRSWLGDKYPALLRAVQHLQMLLQLTTAEGPETSGLLPANLSAEDLGDASQHHYWDDFWALDGLREASFAAGELGHDADAAALNQQASDLQTTLLRSIQAVDARTGLTLIPNGPEDVASSSMARGTTPAVWPVAGLHDADSLLRASFANYFNTWLAPQNGGFRHYQGTLWPYGGLGIAHVMLRLGMLQQVWQVLDWTISHQTLPGTYAWGEAVNPDNGGLELGDMPHSWAAAEFVSLTRDMLLAEQDGVLVVNGGTPDSWLQPGGHVSLRDAPTEYGPASIDLRWLDSSERNLTITLTGNPPLGWRVRVPSNAQQLAIDGESPVPISGRWLDVTSGIHIVRVLYAAPTP